MWPRYFRRLERDIIAQAWCRDDHEVLTSRRFLDEGDPISCCMLAMELDSELVCIEHLI